MKNDANICFISPKRRGKGEAEKVLEEIMAKHFTRYSPINSKQLQRPQIEENQKKQNPKHIKTKLLKKLKKILKAAEQNPDTLLIGEEHFEQLYFKNLLKARRKQHNIYQVLKK